MRWWLGLLLLVGGCTTTPQEPVELTAVSVQPPLLSLVDECEGRGGFVQISHADELALAGMWRAWCVVPSPAAQRDATHDEESFGWLALKVLGGSFLVVLLGYGIGCWRWKVYERERRLRPWQDV